MSNLRADIIFNNSGLDTDSSYEFVIQGDAPHRKNILIGEDGSNGTITQQKGCHQGSASYPLTLSDVYQVVGSYYNNLTRKVYYFIFSLPYDSDLSGTYLYDNKLLEYTEDTGELVCIFTDTANWFGLHFNYFMKDCKMLGDWLFFNPKMSEPKMIDIQKAYYYEQAVNNLNDYSLWDAASTYIYGDRVIYYGGVFLCEEATVAGESPVTDTDKWTRIDDAYQTETNLSFDSEFEYAFDVLKMPPVIRPVIAYGSDAEILSNNVRGKMFRFCYRYKYFDENYSVVSAYSDVARPVDDEEWNGEITGDTSSNNYIKVTVSLHSPALVKEVEIFYQEIGQDWKKCKTINRLEQDELTTNNFTYNFYNNEAYYEVVDSTLITKIYDTVPRTAGAQELINENILSYARCKEGFDNLAKDLIDVSLTPEINAIPTVYDVGTTRKDLVADDEITSESIWDDEEGWLNYAVIDVTNYAAWGVVANDVFRIVVDGTEGTVTLDAGDVASAEDLVNAIALAVHGSFVWADVTHDTDGELWIGSTGLIPEVSVCVFYEPSGDATSVTKHGGFKTGANHPFCLYYYDKNLRRWDAQTSKENLHGVGLEMLGTTVYVPMFMEVSSPYIDTANRWSIDWEVNHLPPEGAKYWRWGYAGNTLCSLFVQYVIEDIGPTADELLPIDITPLQELKDAGVGRNSFPQSVIDPWEWQKGDRIRFITSAGDNDPYDFGEVLDTIYDYEIVKISDDGNTIYTQDFDYGTIGEFSLAEIYRPLKTDTKAVFYEYGPLMRIIEDSSGELVHAGPITNQDSALGTPATGTFEYGDVYHIFRTPSLPLNILDRKEGIFHESMWWSDFYESDEYDVGKPGTETNFNERILNIIRYSHQYLQNTGINGLSTFDGDRYKELNDIYGNIIGMLEVGNTLKVYQQRKPSSILIGRQEYTDSEGNLTVATSDRVFGSIRYSTTNWGTEFAECLERNNRYVYGFDIYNGVMWRDSANGIFPISGVFQEAGAVADYKMSTYFKEKSKALLESGIENVRVLTVWDEEYDLLYVIFHDLVNDDNNDVVVFHEPTNRWISFVELESTEHSGYNVIIELSYDIVTGFSAGIGYEFDEATRFAIFNIVTSAGVVGYWGDVVDLTMEALAPTISIDNGDTQDLNSLSMSVLTPTYHVSYVHATDEYLHWEGTESGSSDYLPTTISNTDTTTIDAIPSWATVTTDLGGILNVGFDVDNETIRVYPNTANNTGATRSDYVTLSDIYGNTLNILCEQDPTSEGVDASIEIGAGSALFLSVSDDTVNASDGSTALALEFTPDHLSYSSGESVYLTYTILKNGGNVGSGGFWVTDEQVNNKTIYMSSAASNGDTVVVYLDGTL